MPSHSLARLACELAKRSSRAVRRPKPASSAFTAWRPHLFLCVGTADCAWPWKHLSPAHDFRVLSEPLRTGTE